MNFTKFPVATPSSKKNRARISGRQDVAKSNISTNPGLHININFFAVQQSIDHIQMSIL